MILYEVIVDDVGTGYEVGDELTFLQILLIQMLMTLPVSMVGGGIQLETATLDDSSLIDDESY